VALTASHRAGPPGGDLRSSFLAGLSFEPDPYQLEALQALDEGHSVVVAAPTGSGKTLVADYAVARALAEGGKTFYTTPLKALSNQKYGDYVRLHGAGRVGLLTGDNSINGEAPVVVMTTEVLRNMVYAGSATLSGLRYVVLDEVHYLQDPYRGPVWEEVIIHLPPEVDLVCLSATVSNAEELADWVATVRGSTRAVIEERRPVPLHNLFMVGDRHSDSVLLMPTLVEGQPNPRGLALGPPAPSGLQARRRSRLFAPRRTEAVELLDQEGLLPAIYFIFSRAGCDEAVRQCLRETRRLTSAAERRQIRAIAEEAANNLSAADLEALGYGSWLAGLEAGFAAHHAGLVPPFKEAVEKCFAAGLVKVVFATETLALGINMPARSVVVERLSKFGGERVEPLTPGEYTQLTGRAGRRGTDDEGYAVVLWAANVSFDQVASLAGSRTYTLTSSFRPTYNMATNLVRRCSPENAHHLLNLSFAQYRADAEVVRLERQLERARAELVVARQGAHCELGDVFEYRRAMAPATGDGPEAGRRAGPRQVLEAMARLRPGDVILLPAERHRGPGKGDHAAVVATYQRRRGEVGLRALTVDRRLVSLGARDFRVPPLAVGRVELPTPFAPSSRAFQRRTAAALEAGYARAVGGPAERRRGRDLAGMAVASCPDLRSHLRAAGRTERLGRQVERLEAQVVGRTESLARQFDRVLELLGSWGYLKDWALTPPGERLSRIYHPMDLLVAESSERGMFEGLRPAELAALVSAFTYEPRGPAGPEELAPQAPSRRAQERWEALQALSAELAAAEAHRGLPVTRRPDLGFARADFEWASGRSLARVLVPADQGGRQGPPTMSAGDFVRNIKQLVDLLRQLAEVLPGNAEAMAASEAAALLFRGVVVVSSLPGTGPARGPLRPATPGP
jgi:ATP-dependent RNA helicase HelY